MVTLWDKQLGRHLDQKETELGKLCHTETIQDIALSPSGEFVVAKCIGNPISFVFSALDGRLIVQTDPQYGVPAPIQFSGDGRRFLVGNSDSRARVWSLDSKSAVGPFLRHPTFVRFGCLSSDGTVAATFSADRKIRIWNSETVDLLHSMFPEVTGQPMWFSQDSLRILVTPNGSKHGSLSIPQFNLERQEVKHFVELITGQEIDNSEGIAELGATAFRNSPQVYMRAWKKSVGGRRE